MRRKEACLVSGHPGKSKNGVFLSAPCYQEVTVKMADKTRRLYLRRVAPFSRDVLCDFAAQYHRILPYLSVLFSRGMKRKIKFIHHTILCFFLNAPYVIFTVFQSKQKIDFWCLQLPEFLMKSVHVTQAEMLTDDMINECFINVIFSQVYWLPSSLISVIWLIWTGEQMRLLTKLLISLDLKIVGTT